MMNFSFVSTVFTVLSGGGYLVWKKYQKQKAQLLLYKFAQNIRTMEYLIKKFKEILSNHCYKKILYGKKFSDKHKIVFLWNWIKNVKPGTFIDNYELMEYCLNEINNEEENSKEEFKEEENEEKTLLRSSEEKVIEEEFNNEQKITEFERKYILNIICYLYANCSNFNNNEEFNKYFTQLEQITPFSHNIYAGLYYLRQNDNKKAGQYLSKGFQENEEECIDFIATNQKIWKLTEKKIEIIPE